MVELGKYHATVARIMELLTKENCTFKTFEHEEVRTSEEAAKVRPGYTLAQGAKALIVRAKLQGGERVFAQVVVPGDTKFDTKKVRAALSAKDIRFATEEEVGEITQGIKPGGVPPFGNLFGLRVLVDESLLTHNEIVFNAGDRRFSIALKTDDYSKVVSPEVVSVV